MYNTPLEIRNISHKKTHIHNTHTHAARERRRHLRKGGVKGSSARGAKVSCINLRQEKRRNTHTHTHAHAHTHINTHTQRERGRDVVAIIVTTGRV